MRKYTALVFALVCVLGVAGCSSGTKTFEIDGAEKFTVMSGTTGESIDVTNADDIKYITDNINALKFSKGESSKGYGDWSYRLRWYDSENKLIEEIVVINEYLIDYKEYFHTGMEADYEIDISYFDTLLDNEE